MGRTARIDPRSRRHPHPAGRRRLAYDDVGDPDGAVVVYLHGCPDSRLTRHPDDSIAPRAGVRLVAVDRPGYGSSDALPDGDECTLADDVDRARRTRSASNGSQCSAGRREGPGALALGGLHPDRVRAVGVAAGQVPIEADRDPEVRSALDPVIATRTDVVSDDVASRVRGDGGPR